MKDPLHVLYAEHEVIVGAVDIVKKAGKLLPGAEPTYDQLVKKLIRFFRMYADKYHHYKEEEILFPEMGKKSHMLEEGIIAEMLENHSDFRDMVGRIEVMVNKGEYTDAQQLLLAYTEMLLDHIAVENDELFQMAETLFTRDELEKIHFRFEDCDSELASGTDVQVSKPELLKELEEIRKIFEEAVAG
jgi:hemerythrin-like domain-containing protein